MPGSQDVTESCRACQQRPALLPEFLVSSTSCLEFPLRFFGARTGPYDLRCRTKAYPHGWDSSISSQIAGNLLQTQCLKADVICQIQQSTALLMR